LTKKYYEGSEVVITTNREQKQDFFIDAIQLNGKAHKSFFLKHEELVKGAVLNFKLSSGASVKQHF